MSGARPEAVKNPLASSRGAGKDDILTPRKLAWKKFRRNQAALAGLAVLTILVAISLLAPVLQTHDRDAFNLMNREMRPSREHLLGTDVIGRDVFTRTLHGGRVSLSVGLLASLIQLGIGVLLGSIAGYYGKLADALIMRLTDVVLAFPFLALALVVASILGPSPVNTALTIGLLAWTTSCRLVRGQFLLIRQSEYIEAAKALGIRELQIIRRHMLPNALAPILISATLTMSSAILVEASLSFLGLGVRPPLPSWGNMLEAARNMRVVGNMWWLWVPPGLMIILAVLSINFIGDGLRDALDPRLKKGEAGK